MKDHPDYKKLSDACVLGDIETAQILLDKKISLFQVDENGISPAISAFLISGNPKLMKLIVKYLIHHQETPANNLILTTAQQRIIQISQFIKARNINLELDENLLKSFSIGILKTLPENEIRVLMGYIQKFANIPLLNNAENGLYDHVDFMLDHGIDVNTTYRNKNLFVVWVYYSKFNEQLLDIILKYKPNKIINHEIELLIDGKKYFLTPLALALYYMNMSACHKLLDSDANFDVNSIFNLKITNNGREIFSVMKLPFVLAQIIITINNDEISLHAGYDLFEKILKKGLSLKTWMDEINFEFSLMEGMVEERVKLFELMLKYGIKRADDYIQVSYNQNFNDVRTVEKKLELALHTTVLLPTLIPYLTYLLNEKLENVDIDVLNAEGYSALELACLNGNAPAVKKLLDHGASPYKYCEEFGGNILAIPCAYSDIEIVKLIVEKHPLTIMDFNKAALEPHTNLYKQIANDLSVKKFVKFYDNNPTSSRIKYMHNSTRKREFQNFPASVNAFRYQSNEVLHYLLEKGAPYDRMFKVTKKGKKISLQLNIGVSADIRDYEEVINLLINKFIIDHPRYEVTFVNKLASNLLNYWQFDTNHLTMKEKVEKSKSKQDHLYTVKRNPNNHRKKNYNFVLLSDNSNGWEIETCPYPSSAEKYFIETKGLSLKEFNYQIEEEERRENERKEANSYDNSENNVKAEAEITWLNGKISSKMPEITHIDGNHYCYIDKINIKEQSGYCDNELKKYYNAVKDFSNLGSGVKPMKNYHLYVRPRANNVPIFKDKVPATYKIKVKGNPRVIGFTVLSDNRTDSNEKKAEVEETKKLTMFTLFEDKSHKMKLLRGAYKNGKVVNFHLPEPLEDDNCVKNNNGDSSRHCEPFRRKGETI